MCRGPPSAVPRHITASDPRSCRAKRGVETSDAASLAVSMIPILQSSKIIELPAPTVRAIGCCPATPSGRPCGMPLTAAGRGARTHAVPMTTSRSSPKRHTPSSTRFTNCRRAQMQLARRRDGRRTPSPGGSVGHSWGQTSPMPAPTPPSRRTPNVDLTAGTARLSFRSAAAPSRTRRFTESRPRPARTPHTLRRSPRRDHPRRRPWGRDGTILAP